MAKLSVHAGVCEVGRKSSGIYVSLNIDRHADVWVMKKKVL